MFSTGHDALADIADANANETAAVELKNEDRIDLINENGLSSENVMNFSDEDIPDQNSYDTSIETHKLSKNVGELSSKDIGEEKATNSNNTKAEDVDDDENKENQSKPRFKLGVYSRREAPIIKVFQHYRGDKAGMCFFRIKN